MTLGGGTLAKNARPCHGGIQPTHCRDVGSVPTMAKRQTILQFRAYGLPGRGI